MWSKNMETVRPNFTVCTISIFSTASYTWSDPFPVLGKVLDCSLVGCRGCGWVLGCDNGWGSGFDAGCGGGFSVGCADGCGGGGGGGGGGGAEAIFKTLGKSPFCLSWSCWNCLLNLAYCARNLFFISTLTVTMPSCTVRTCLLSAVAYYFPNT